MTLLHRYTATALIALAGASSASADIELDLSITVNDAKPYSATQSFKEGEETSVRIDDTYSVRIVPTVTEKGAVSVATKVMRSDDVLAEPRIVTGPGKQSGIGIGTLDAEGKPVNLIDIRLTPRITIAL